MFVKVRRLLLAYGLVGLAGCSGTKDRPPFATAMPGTGGSAFNVGTGGSRCGPAVPDAGLCGNEILPTQQDRPNLYFVVDASGSMSNTFSSSSPQKKYPAAVQAITAVLAQIGHRVSYGAATFPVDNGSDCGLVGKQVFPTQAGDSVICSINGEMGDVLTNLQSVLGHRAPGGGTLLSATLKALKPTLMALTGKTVVILATDGAPNCNPDASCGPELCERNLARYQFPNGTVCEGTLNCCDPKVVVDGNLDCVDSVATYAALSDLLSNGIATYVIGLPGYDPVLGAVLDSMAISGGTARDTYPRYYEADDPQTLADTLRAIATKVAVSCTIALENAPPSWSLVNVYFDSQRIPHSVDNGWQQIDEHTLEITGTYCTTLQTGNVYQVQVAAGCPTYVN